MEDPEQSAHRSCKNFVQDLQAMCFHSHFPIAFRLCVLIAVEILLLVGLVSVGQKILIIIITKKNQQFESLDQRSY